MTRRVLACTAATTLALATCGYAATPEPAAIYDAFNRFCLESFNAGEEPLAAERLGADLTVTEDSHWLYASEVSASIAWSTNLPALSSVEYGLTRKLGEATPQPERPFHTHLHYLRDLKPGATYYYRVVGIDPAGKRVEGEIQSFKTEAKGAAGTPIDALPGGGQPLVIDKPGKYVVTADLVADGTAFDIKTAGVTLDLGGHRITYNQKQMEPISGDDPNEWFKKAPHGVWVGDYNRKGIVVLNGTITQGDGGDGAQVNGRGANPIAAMSGITGESAGVTYEWHGEQVSGFMMPYGPEFDLHHNVLTDKGSGMTNRHQGVAAIRSVVNARYNLIKRTRQRGIDCVDNGKIIGNEVYIDSVATNSTGIATYKTKNLLIKGNYVYGGGYLAIGIGLLSDGTKDVKVEGNYIHLQASAPSDASSEYGDQSGAYCLRVTWGGQNLEVYDNTFIAYGRDKGMVRGVWYCPDTNQTNNVIRDNVIKAMVQNEMSDVRGAVVISGSEDSEKAEPPLFLRNRILSNFCSVLLGEPYGKGCNATFRENVFERVGDLPRFRFVQIGYGNFQCIGVRLIDSTFVGSISPDQVLWADATNVDRSFTVEKSITVRGKQGDVTITDIAGNVVAQGSSVDADGFTAPLPVTLYKNGSAEPAGPYTVSLGGQTKKIDPNNEAEVEF